MLKNNPALRTLVAWAIITGMAVLGLFLPSFLGIEGFAGGFAISLMAFLLAITGLIVIIIYAGRAKKLGSILRGEGVIAHWSYSAEEWKAYTEKEYVSEKSEKKTLFIITAVLAIIIGLGFFIFDQDAGFWVLVGMVVLVGILAFTAWFTAWYRHWENSKYHGEAYITGKSVYLNRQFHTWSGPGEKLESIDITNKKGQSILVIVYSVWTRNGRTPATIRIPVPAGKEEEAESIAAGLKFKVEGGTAAPG
jgi:hypothetical protein